MRQEHWTAKRSLHWATDLLQKHHIEAPHLESEILLSHNLNTKRTKLFTNFEKPLSPSQLARYKNTIIRKTKGEPTAYITGKKWFMDLEFDVTPDVLIPRPETELLVEKIIDLTRNLRLPAPAQVNVSVPTITIADIGTGSGCIAISLAKHLPNSHIYGTDLSAEALMIAKRNALKHEVSARCQFLQGNLLQPLENKKFDFIVSNPPYVSQEDVTNDYEPKLALNGGKKGLDYYPALIKQARNHLKPDGSLLLEVGYGQADEVALLMQKENVYDKPQVIKDYAKIERVVIGKYIKA